MAQKADDARDIGRAVRERMVDELASGRMRHFDRESIKAAVDVLFDHADERYVTNEVRDIYGD